MPNTTIDIKEIVNNVLTKEQYEIEQNNNRVIANQFYNTTENINPNDTNISSEFPISGHIISYDSAIFSTPTTSFRILRNVKYSVPNGFKEETSKLDSLVFLLTTDITVTPSTDGLFLLFLTDNIAQALLVPITDVGDTPNYRYHYDSTQNIWKDGENVKYFCPIGICKKQGSTVTITPLKWKVLTYSDKSLIEDWFKPKQIEVNNGTTVSIAVQENTYYKFLNKIDTLTVSSFPNSDSDSVLLFQANKDNMTIAVTGATDDNFLNKLTTSTVDNKYIMSVRNGLFAVNKDVIIEPPLIIDLPLTGLTIDDTQNLSTKLDKVIKDSTGIEYVYEMVDQSLTNRIFYKLVNGTFEEAFRSDISWGQPLHYEGDFVYCLTRSAPYVFKINLKTGVKTECLYPYNISSPRVDNGLACPLGIYYQVHDGRPNGITKFNTTTDTLETTNYHDGDDVLSNEYNYSGYANFMYSYDNNSIFLCVSAESKTDNKGVWRIDGLTCTKIVSQTTMNLSPLVYKGLPGFLLYQSGSNLRKINLMDNSDTVLATDVQHCLNGFDLNKGQSYPVEEIPEYIYYRTSSNTLIEYNPKTDTSRTVLTGVTANVQPGMKILGNITFIFYDNVVVATKDNFSTTYQVTIPSSTVWSVIKMNDNIYISGADGNTYLLNTDPNPLPPPPSLSYLTFSSPTAFSIAARDSIISGNTYGISSNRTMDYSTDAVTWNSWDGHELSVSAGNEIYIKGTITNNGSNVLYTNFTFPTGSNISCTGDIRSLDDSINPQNVVLRSYCYYAMFSDCSSLIQVPSLPSTTVVNGCYGYMFSNCTSLTQLPALPATTLANSCYYAMFSGCTSLTQAPSPLLLVTELFNSCYREMFKDCTSLTQPPALPATRTATDCYNEMFMGCTSLVNAPALPATNIGQECYYQMFKDCTSLVQAPALPATNLAEACYANMFQGCSSLVNAPALPATSLTRWCYDSMFAGCSSLIEAPLLPAMTLARDCYSYMFYGCSSLVNPPLLPATTLATWCYSYMFMGCSSLVIPPNLPATSLVDSCYWEMLENCTSLKISQTQTGIYNVQWRIPSSGNGTESSSWNYRMLTNTGGTFKSQPVINTTYYYPSTNSTLVFTTAPNVNNVTLHTFEDQFYFPYITSVDWGDGTSALTKTHTYSTQGTYTITVVLNDSTIGDRDNVYFFCGSSNVVSAVFNSENLTYLGDVFQNSSISTLTLNAPNFTYLTGIMNYSTISSCTINAPYVESIHGILEGSTISSLTINAANLIELEYWFLLNTSISTLTVNSSNSFSIGENSLDRINSPFVLNATNLTFIDRRFLRNCNSSMITLETPNLTSIGYDFLQDSYVSNISLHIHSDTVVNLGSNPNFNALEKVYVPANLVNTYKTTAPWSQIPDKIFPCPQNYLTFTSPTAFSVAARAGDTSGTTYGISSNRTMEYSTNGTTWTSWDGHELSVSAGGSVYIRGTITADGSLFNYTNFTFPTGTNISCTGDIRTLDNYNDPENVVLRPHCYEYMFGYCTSLTEAPSLPATTLANSCYAYMFAMCVSLSQPPDLPATTLAENCCICMFNSCSAIKISQTRTGTYQTPWRIPTSGTGTVAINWNVSMLYNTGGTFAGDPSINTTYYYSLT